MCWEALSMGKVTELQLSKWKVTEVEAQMRRVDRGGGASRAWPWIGRDE